MKSEFEFTADMSRAVHSMWVAYLSHSEHAAKNPNKSIDADFVYDAFEGLKLFDQLKGIAESWSTETDLNFDELTLVFTTYLKHSNSVNSQKTLFLFANIFQLIAAILEHKAFVKQQFDMFKTITDAVGNLDDDEWYKVLTNKSA